MDKRIGAQLYTVRDFCKTKKKFAETLERVADIGYKTVQVSGTCKYEPEWLSEQLERCSLKCVITHIPADELIENTAKSTRRNETVDEAYIANLYKDVTSLYRLDQTANSSIEKQDFGKMPVMAVALISTLSVIWICIGIYQGVTVVKNRKK